MLQNRWVASGPEDTNVAETDSQDTQAAAAVDIAKIAAFESISFSEVQSVEDANVYDGDDISTKSEKPTLYRLIDRCSPPPVQTS